MQQFTDATDCDLFPITDSVLELAFIAIDFQEDCRLSGEAADESCFCLISLKDSHIPAVGHWEPFGPIKYESEDIPF